MSGLGVGVWLHALAMLAVVLGLIAATGWALKRWGNNGNFGLTLGKAKAAPRYRIVSRLSLSPTHTLIELETPSGPQTLVLGPNGATVLPQNTPKILKKNRK